MSEYLKQKMLRQLKEAKEALTEPCEDIRENVLSEGMSHMKSRIGDMNINTAIETPVEKPEAYQHYKGAELAETTIDVYRSNINPKKEKVEETVNEPVTKAKTENIKAMARTLAGARNGGNGGKLTQSTPSGNGDLGEDSATTGEGGNQKNTGDNYHALTTSMTLEEYEAYIRDQWGLNEQEEVEEEVVQELVEDNKAIKELEEGLLKLEDTSWQSIDKLMRGIAKDHDMTPKELHKEFKSHHDGMIPDDWVKEQVQVEECGWFPLKEATLYKNGMAYDVSLIWRGHTRRLKFFWPEMRTPSRGDMQDAVKKFYPGGRLLAFYPCDEDTNNPMVLVPPMTENYVMIQYDEWTTLSESEMEIYNTICDEVGNPVGSPYITEDNSYAVVVEDYDTGQQRIVTFGEGAAWTKKSGQNQEGGLNEKGRKSYEKANPGSDLKAPTKDKGNPRRKSFCARMQGMRKRQKKSNNTGEDRLSKSLKAWDC